MPTKGAATIPDVRGLSQQDAVQAISDSGAGVTKVVVAQKPHVGPEGFVVGQDPVGGASGQGTLTLFLPVAATMPNLSRKSEVDAKSELEALGSAVTEQRTYRRGFAAGTVISTDPVPGALLTEDSVLVVGADPSSRYLADVSFDGPCRTSEVSISGGHHDKGIACDAQRSADLQETVWLLNRKVDELTGPVGLDDHSIPGVDAVLTVSGDDRTLFRQRLSYGKATPVRIDVRGVLRLTVTAQVVNDLAENAPTVALGDLTLNGTESDLAGLTGH